MPYLAQNTELGKLEVLEVYEYYDIPRLFLCTNQHGHFYIALSVAETNECNTWFYVPITKHRLKQVRVGEIDLYDAFKFSEEQCVFEVTTLGSGPDTVTTVMSDELENELLPYKGPKLDIPNSKTIPKSSYEIAPPTLPGISDSDIGKTTDEILIQSFSDIRNGWSVDRVIADPDLAPLFIKQCENYNLKADPVYLFTRLMRLRKGKQLSHLPKAKRNGLDVGVNNTISFASELAYRLLRLKKGVTLDQILCDPKLVLEFDALATDMSPGYKPLDYRLAALNVRKRGSYKPTDERVNFGLAEHVKKVRLDNIPEAPGLYLFSSNDRPIFINQTDNLKNRLSLHLQNTDFQGLPKYAWSKPLQYSLVETPGISSSLRQSLEQIEIRERRTFLNFFSCESQKTA